MNKTLAPIALFVYNRPTHTKKVIDALKKNSLSKQSELYIFSDGPKTGKNMQLKKVRKYLRTINGFKKIKIIERKENLGLAKSIITGLKEVLSRHEQVIILEDDIRVSKYFLEFMNDSLKMYNKEKKIFGISGYTYKTKKELPNTFFLKLTNCWGWATWKRSWKYFEEDGEKLLKKIKSKKLQKKFDINGSYPYFKMLKNQIKGKNNSWAIRWYASIFLKNGLFLYPKESLTENIGFGKEGIHCKYENIFKAKFSKISVKPSMIPIRENKFARKEFHQFFKSIFFKRIFKRIKRTVSVFSK